MGDMADWVNDNGELTDLLEDRPEVEPPAKPPPIPCRPVYSAVEFDCAYAHAGELGGCENCIVNGGQLDPRTGKPYRPTRKKKK